MKHANNRKIQMMRLVWIVAVALAFAGCGRKSDGGGGGAAGKVNGAADARNADSKPASMGDGGELPLPAIPSTLKSSSERSAYVVEHFWDTMDFGDTLRSHDRDFLELNFSNFVYLLPYASPASAEKAVVLLMGKAETDKGAFLLLAELAEKYLSEPNSPMRNEDLFIYFLNCQTAATVLDDTEKMRARSLLRMALKNRPGMRAADFEYTGRDGRRHTLYGTKSADRMLLVFYDPECEHCAEITASLAANGVLDELQGEGRLTVLAIDTESNREVWERTKGKMPQHWIVGHDAKGAINGRGLYCLPAMPVLYLLDADKTVILKDATPEAAEREVKS